MDDKKSGVGIPGLLMEEPLLFEKSVRGRVGYSLPAEEMEELPLEEEIPASLLRETIEGFPELSEVDVVRHFTRLSQWNYGVDTGMYPLGSCTMKYNPKINEDLARLEGLATLHPYQPESLSQGALELMYLLAEYLSDISGMDSVTLQPAAGAHGELSGMMMIRAYHQSRGRPRSRVLIPDTAHGTNPASCTVAGYKVQQIPSGPDGILEPSQVREAMDEEVAALMLTNPNTLGLFEQHIKEISEIVHNQGGLVYCDGANLNALMGIAKPGHMGVDVIQFNLHKTFSTPHGGGGPGSGPVGIKSILEPFQPVPIVMKEGDRFHLSYDLPQSIGKIRSFYGNFGIFIRAYSYIRSMGSQGLKLASEISVLNANYLRSRLEGTYHLPYTQPCMHECVFTDKHLAPTGVTTLNVAKRLMDYGLHPPTIYFPLVVSGALMMEPTESESKESIDQFAEALLAISREAEINPEVVQSAPHLSKVRRLDETRAARQCRLKWTPEDK